MLYTSALTVVHVMVALSSAPVPGMALPVSCPAPVSLRLSTGHNIDRYRILNYNQDGCCTLYVLAWLACNLWIF